MRNVEHGSSLTRFGCYMVKPLSSCHLAASRLMRAVSRASAALCALLALSAHAETGEGGTTLTLYGVVDAGIASTRTTGMGSSTGVLGGGLSDNLWGLRGSEDLGGGAAAVFALESGYDLTTGQSNEPGRLFDYDAWVGLRRDGVGELRLGRQRTIAMSYGSALEVASWRQMGMGALLRASDNFRRDNLVNITSADLGGWQAGVGYAFDTAGPDGPADRGRGHALSAGVKYESDPWLAVLTWDRLTLPSGSPAHGATPTAWQAGVARDFDGLRVSLAWSRQRDGFTGQNGGGVDGLGPLAFIDGGRADTWLVGAEYELRAHDSVLMQFSMARPTWHWDDGSRAERVRLLTLGYRHALSPRTTLYSFVGRLWQGTLDEPFVQGAGHTTRYMAGLNHTF